MASPLAKEALATEPTQDEQLHSEGPDPNEATSDPDTQNTTQEEQYEKLRREREARAQALTLEIVGDLPYAEVKPPENVLFVCKLNPVTEDEDLNLIFSRFGKIISCEVIRDKRTRDSLQYAFIEFEDQKACEQAYFKMQGVLIDDHRIHVDFSQSRAKQAGGFGGVASLEKKRQYRAMDAEKDRRRKDSSGYDLVLDKDDLQMGGRGESDYRQDPRRSSRSRSRSPPRRDHRKDRRSLERDGQRRRQRSRDRHPRDRDRYDHGRTRY
ncbi:MAG: hypothetical protein L6R37_002467 [Teloschistes peruensis]|nr:MAG: hypothetical protein L6R37_002467 [Teloschistes peruensis]